MTRRFQTSTAGEALCHAEDPRSCYRVEVTRDILIELAVWFSNSKDVRRIHLKDLGPPAFSLGKPPYPFIDNISASGLALSFFASGPGQSEAFQERLPLALVYFKVQDPSGAHSSPLSFMAGYAVKRVEYAGGRIRLGMCLALDGVPHPGELVLDFVDARKYGNACLTKWCEDMHRRSARPRNSGACPGLRLDMLLSQLDLAMTEIPGHAV